MSINYPNAQFLNQQELINNDSQNESKYLLNISQPKNELKNPSLFQKDKKEKPEEEINSKEKIEEEKESLEKVKKSEKYKKSKQHNVSAEYQLVNTKSLNNLCGKIGSLIEEMKELNLNQGKLIKLLTRKFFPEEVEYQGFKSETGYKK